MTMEVDISWVVIGQAAAGVRDRGLIDLVASCQKETNTQRAWLQTHIKQAAPQALIVAE